MTQEILNELAALIAKQGPGWQDALGRLFQSQLRPHAEEMKAFEAELAQLAGANPTTSDQLDYGTNGLVIGGLQVASAYVGVADAGKTTWIEDWAIKDKASFLSLLPTTGTCELQYVGGYGGGADAQLLAWTATAAAWRSTMVCTYISAASIPTAPSVTVTEFELKRGTNQGGHLFRETWTAGGQTWVADHWVLRMSYAPPTAGSAVQVVFVTATANLASRLATLKAEAAGTDNNRPKSYVFASNRLHEYPKL